MKDSITREKAYSFGIKVVRTYQSLQQDKKEFILSKQLLRSGTSVGAQLAEAGYAQSKADFISKLSISLKEVHETIYWLNLLKDTDYLSLENHKLLSLDAEEILKLLVASLNTLKK